MASAAKKRSKRPQAPTPRPIRSRRLPLWIYFGGGAGMVVVGVLIVVLTTRGGGSSSAVAGLPQTSDYHSLLVARTSADRILLGTHNGIYRTTDGGLHWAPSSLANRDAMNLARAGSAGVVFMAGHDVFARS